MFGLWVSFILVKKEREREKRKEKKRKEKKRKEKKRKEKKRKEKEKKEKKRKDMTRKDKTVSLRVAFSDSIFFWLGKQTDWTFCDLLSYL
jgi:predicted RND superfamily exporter protein